MTVFPVIALLITLKALFGFVNSRFIELPAIVGMMLMDVLVVFSILVRGPSIKQVERRMREAAPIPAR